MLTFIDNFLNKITMYRLVLYILLAMLGIAAVFSAFGILSYSGIGIIYSSVLLVTFSWVSNKLLGWFFNVPVNVESSLITALILALIISPPIPQQFISIIPFFALVSVTAMASKFVINIGKKHIFNPAALAVVITSLVIGKSASWWVGTTALIPYMVVFGLMMARKLRQFDLVLAFFAAVIIGTIGITYGTGHALNSVWVAIVESPLIFFGTIMLTEPMTIPPTRYKRVFYAILVGLLFIPQVKFGPWSLTPEIALLIGNFVSYVLSPKGRHVFTLQNIRTAGDAAFDFVFRPDRPFAFEPGQYMEWTLGHRGADSRGNRRYFTIASSPTEPQTILGVKFYENPSTFKQTLRHMQRGQSLVGAQLAGDFVMPKDVSKKLVFIAGGIGITPFRSMTKYMIDTGEYRDVVLLYSNRTASEIAYLDIFYEAAQKFGMKTVNTITDSVPQGWTGYTGFINKDMIVKEVPDYKERLFYISGSRGMVTAFKKTLLDLGVSRTNIKTDFFPGLA